jgi:hypothetical protein
MNKELQRIKIAEACGYSKGWDYRYGWSATPWNEWCIKSLPDYLNDLNAMHEAEKILNQQQARDYAEHLGHSAQDGTWAGCHIWYQSAAQRAEAFLRTLNLWEE